MAQGFSKELVGVRDNTQVPAAKADGRVYHARRRSIRATLDLAQASVQRQIGDTNVLGVIPKGHRFAGYEMVTDTSLGSSTVAIGNSTDAAAYRAAAAFTATETPYVGGKVAARAAAPGDDSVLVFMTVGAAALPASGIVVFELFYTGR